jgi:hypothetical protein
MNRGLALVLALLAGCASEKPDPRKKVAEETPPLAVEANARVLVASLSEEQVTLWTDGVQDLEPVLRSAVQRELARKAIAVREEDPPDASEPTHKETQAIRLLLARAPKDAVDFIDYLVWKAAHQGAEGAQQIWSLGLRAFPAVLKLRRDRHPAVREGVGVLVAESLLGSQRKRASTDEQILAFCTDELTRCPADCRPHYHAIQAALGDATALEAFPALLKSPVDTDQVYAHLLLDEMISKGSPYGDRELRTIITTPPGKRAPEAWTPVTRRILSWWEKSSGRLVYDVKAATWNVEN